MSFPYKNPITASQLSGSESVTRAATFGTNFSVLQTGGYMEVYSLSDLNWSTYGVTSGAIQNSGNTIPIQFTKGTGTSFSRDVLTLNSDNISSGRRRLGMQVFVQETETVYQYTIPNYETLWNALTGLTGNSGITVTEYATSVNNRSQAGRDFINAWTGSTIEGQSGTTREDARWRIFYGTDVQITGGTYFSGTQELDLYNKTLCVCNRYKKSHNLTLNKVSKKGEGKAFITNVNLILKDIGVSYETDRQKGRGNIHICIC